MEIEFGEPSFPISKMLKLVGLTHSLGPNYPLVHLLGVLFNDQPTE